MADATSEYRFASPLGDERRAVVGHPKRRFRQPAVNPLRRFPRQPQSVRRLGGTVAVRQMMRQQLARHLAVDTLGLVLAVVVHGAYWQDHDGACFLFMRLRESFRRIQVVFGDSAYGRNGLPDWVKETFGWILQTVLRPVGVKGFVVLPKRWIVERTFAWIGRCRRHSKDYERNPETSETMIYISMIALMSKRLAGCKNQFEDTL